MVWQGVNTRKKIWHLTETVASQYETRFELFSVQGITVLKWRRFVLELKERILWKFVNILLALLRSISFCPVNKSCPKIRRYLSRSYALSQNCENRRSASSCPSVCPHGNNSAPTMRIFMKFDIWVFFEIQALLKSDKNSWRTLHYKQYIFFYHFSLNSSNNEKYFRQTL